MKKIKIGDVVTFKGKKHTTLYAHNFVSDEINGIIKYYPFYTNSGNCESLFIINSFNDDETVNIKLTDVTSKDYWYSSTLVICNFLNGRYELFNSNSDWIVYNLNLNSFRLIN